MIKVENLQARINGQEILKGVELHLEPGDIYALLGPNGAGKSTTIFVLLGLCDRSGGRVDVLGGDPQNHDLDIRRSVGVMPERSGFYGWMTAAAYLHWYAGLHGRSPSDSDLHGLLGKVGLDQEQDRLIGLYSRGMKQRLAVARALIHRPRLLILDEPTNGLDPKGRREIHDLLREFVGQQKTAVLLCTHLLDDVDRLCNRLGIIDRGRTRLEGPLSEVLVGPGAGGRYCLRLERPPETSDLPSGITLLAREGDRWRIQLEAGTLRTPADFWGELVQRGWRVLEIRSEASGLEELYLNITDQKEPGPQEEKP